MTGADLTRENLMSAFYGLYGELRLCKCREVSGIIKDLRLCSVLEMYAGDDEDGVITFEIDDGTLASHAAIDEFDELITSLGPYLLEPAVLIRDYDHEENPFIIAATEKAERETLSRHHLKQISGLLHDLTAEDRADWPGWRQTTPSPDVPTASGIIQPDSIRPPRCVRPLARRPGRPNSSDTV